MDKPDLDRFKKLIEQRIAEIEKELVETAENSEAISPDVSIGRLSRLDSMQHQQIALASKRRHEEERNRLHEANRRIETGSYGRCLLCGGSIDMERLEIQPDAVTCVPCTRRK